MGRACEKRLEEGGRPEGMEMFLFFGQRGREEEEEKQRDAREVKVSTARNIKRLSRL